jgi:hypothetical protein
LSGIVWQDDSGFIRLKIVLYTTTFARATMNRKTMEWRIRAMYCSHPLELKEKSA